jgi:hypothetical protein
MKVMRKKSTKKVTMRDLLSIELLELCQKTNAKMRVPDDVSRKFPKEKVEKLGKLAHAVYGDSTYGNRMMQWAAELFDAPELASGRVVFPLFSVIVLEKKNSGHGYKLKEPHIVTHSENRVLLHSDGHMGRWNFDPVNDEAKLATDEEIVKFINNLTDEQWKVIATNPLFNPLAQAILEREVEIPDEAAA